LGSIVKPPPPIAKITPWPSPAGLALEEWIEGHPDLVRKVVVPAQLRWEVRDKLDQANVTERVLFPGLDGISAWLTRYYAPRRADRFA